MALHDGGAVESLHFKPHRDVRNELGQNKAKHLWELLQQSWYKLSKKSSAEADAHALVDDPTGQVATTLSFCSL